MEQKYSLSPFLRNGNNIKIPYYLFEKNEGHILFILGEKSRSLSEIKKRFNEMFSKIEKDEINLDNQLKYCLSKGYVFILEEE